jgi:putative component of membrane protein insertase Oxa1/YidC/SpoIIIJ protein YidD
MEANLPGVPQRNFGQRTLLAHIRFYRHRLSGRGPFGRATCGFAPCESCSAFGLRVATYHATSLPTAIFLIRSRLNRCGEAYLYREPGGWAWGRLYDISDPEALVTKLSRAGELPVAIAAVLRAAAAVGAARSDACLARRCQERADQLTDERVNLVVHTSGSPIKGHRRLLILSFLLYAIIPLAVVDLFFPSWQAYLGAVILGAVSFLSLLRKLSRLYQQQKRTRGIHTVSGYGQE